MPKPEAPRPSKSWISILLAAMLAAMVAIGLMFLTLGVTGIVILIGAGVFGLAALHYLVWGWWLTRSIREEQEAERLRTGVIDRPPWDNTHRD